MWKERYQNWPSNSGQYYKDIQPYPLKTPWFKYGRYKNRIKTTMISRMRINHCCTPSHLNKIGIKEHPNCICGGLGDINHIIFGCTMDDHGCKTRYYKAAQSEHGPVNIKSILANPNSKLLLYLVDNLIQNNIKL